MHSSTWLHRGTNKAVNQFTAQALRPRQLVMENPHTWPNRTAHGSWAGEHDEHAGDGQENTMTAYRPIQAMHTQHTPSLDVPLIHNTVKPSTQRANTNRYTNTCGSSCTAGSMYSTLLAPLLLDVAALQSLVGVSAAASCCQQLLRGFQRLVAVL